MAEEPATIEVRVHDVHQLFNSLDPSPFHERDLDDEAEDYIVGWAREHGTDGPFRIVVHLPKDKTGEAQRARLDAAITNHFAYRLGMVERDAHELVRTGLRFLVVGTTMLTVCMVLGYVARKYVFSEPYGSFVEQGLSVFGWVANWRPAEILLYDRLDARRRVRLYRSLADASVELQATT